MLMRVWAPVRHKTDSDATDRAGASPALTYDMRADDRFVSEGTPCGCPDPRIVMEPFFIASVGARFIAPPFYPAFCLSTILAGKPKCLGIQKPFERYDKCFIQRNKLQKLVIQKQN